MGLQVDRFHECYQHVLLLHEFKKFFNKLLSARRIIVVAMTNDYDDDDGGVVAFEIFTDFDHNKLSA